MAEYGTIIPVIIEAPTVHKGDQTKGIADVLPGLCRLRLKESNLSGFQEMGQILCERVLIWNYRLSCSPAFNGASD